MWRNFISVCLFESDYSNPVLSPSTLKLKMYFLENNIPVRNKIHILNNNPMYFLKITFKEKLFSDKIQILFSVSSNNVLCSEHVSE